MRPKASESESEIVKVNAREREREREIWCLFLRGIVNCGTTSEKNALPTQRKKRPVGK